MQSEIRQLNDHPFFVRSWGDSSLPPLLLLHGFPEYSGAWADLAPLLADRFHCIAPDQRGYGQSWAPEDVSNYALSKLVGDMVALIDQTGAPLTVMGHDWGAAVAYGLAMSRPDLVSQLIIANGVHPNLFQRELAKGGAQSEASQYFNTLRHEGSQDALAKDDFALMLRLFSAKMDLSWLSGDRLAEYKTEWARPGRLEGMINWYRATPLQVADPGKPLSNLRPMPVEQMQVHCPHLLLWGEGDTALLPETTEGLEEFAADLTRVTIAGTDHWLCHQNPEAVAAAILDWAG
jgi:epoxide hydrolase 4